MIKQSQFYGQISLVIALVMAFFLSACGRGGGGTTGDSVDGMRGTPPQERRDDDTMINPTQQARSIIARTDSLISAALYGETSRDELPNFRIEADCSVEQCIYRETQSGIARFFTLRELTNVEPTLAFVDNDMSIYRSEENDTIRYYGLMNHSVFGFGTTYDQRSPRSNIDFWGRTAIVGGDLTRSRPESTATWNGIMLGTPSGTAGRTAVLRGAAQLTYDMDRQQIDAAFTNIRNQNGRAYAVRSIRFDDIPVTANGLFNDERAGDSIQGAFYGPAHIESAGVFEKRGVVGSFGVHQPTD
ncbi:MAG: hypothetical protein OXC62_09820 [Aestuariivita sp.]|nr:hypothetical protein [Aestuariivita sp.]